ncbi:diguanylate cyclase [Salisediminibacterium beveridgei]|uniref:Diguanylate cyclase n=1 Tax=Salisediminibacterium beveridgei TaxID=632773 RepID=A0A1D7QR11_9BACI|nr:diguanylate cyclase [Salisediminibacterium beveridgei]
MGFLIVLLFLFFSPILSAASDDSGWHLQKDGTIELEDGWLFVWDELLSLQDARIHSGQAEELSSLAHWENNAPTGSRGVATYYQKLNIDEASVGTPLGLYVPDILTSYRLWIDGELVHQQGTVSDEAASSVPSVMPVIKQIVAEEETIEIMLHIANHHHREGGPMASLRLGAIEDMHHDMLVTFVVEVILFGALMLSAGHHFLIYLLRRKDRENLYFSLFCMILAIRVSVTGQKVLYQMVPDFSWIVGIHLEYLSFYAGAGILLLYLHQMFIDHASHKMTYTLAGITALFSVYVIAAPIRIFSESLAYFQAFTVVLIVYAFFILYQAGRDHVQGAHLTMILFGLFTITIMNDIFYHLRLFDTILLAPFGMLFMIFGQTSILTLRTISAYRKVEELSMKQQAWHRHLEEEVESRTNELEEANKHLKMLSEVDGLTRIPNRRLFDEEIESQLILTRQAIQPMALLMIDVDDYKGYNDFYGHLKGDDCLKTIANHLEETVKTVQGGAIYRYGGEEFAVLLPGVDQEGASVMAEHLRQAIETENIPHEGIHTDHRVTVSIGGAVIQPGQFATSDMLIKTSDQALYQAKGTGKNKVVIEPSVG